MVRFRCVRMIIRESTSHIFVRGSHLTQPSTHIQSLIRPSKLHRHLSERLLFHPHAHALDSNSTCMIQSAFMIIVLLFVLPLHFVLSPTAPLKAGAVVWSPNSILGAVETNRRPVLMSHLLRRQSSARRYWQTPMLQQ